MSKYTLKKTLKREIDNLNWRIDMKIIKGLPYREEARRHKFLLAQIKRLSREASGISWLERATQVMTSFVL